MQHEEIMLSHSVAQVSSVLHSLPCRQYRLLQAQRTFAAPIFMPLSGGTDERGNLP